MALIKMIEGDDEARQNKCTAVINGILKQFDCTLVPVVIIVGAKIAAHRVDVIAKPRSIKVPPGVTDN